MNFEEIKKKIKGFKITNCSIRDTGEMGFVAQNNSNDDPLDPRETLVFINKPYEEEKSNKWGMAGLGTCRRMLVAPSYIDDERWLFVSGTGDIYVVCNNTGFENPIGKGYIFGIKNLVHKSCFMVGPKRKVVKRERKNKLLFLGTDIPSKDYPIKEEGFCDVDGFSEKDLYACGGSGDLWHYDGKVWKFVVLPTNVPLNKISCGQDGKVYILADNRFFIIGREDKWIEYSSDNFKGLGADIKWYKDRLLILTGKKGYQLKDNELLECELIESSPIDGYSCFATCGDKLLLANGYECALYDGVSWRKIL